MAIKKTKNTNPFPKMEEEILNFWDKAKTFEKSVNKKAPQGDYVFYDGPPFGTGEPHYGHILSSVAKDVVPRYWTMQGFRVERRWGWDCHGLPIENIIEEDLGINGKKEIEKMGIDKFNQACQARVLEYADIWDKMVRRIARWIDFKNSYKTMDMDFMESVWWAFKELWKKDLIYKGRRVLLYCPRCETPISNFEVAMDNSYKEITEPSVYVKFKVKSDKSKVISNKDTYILAWTTTPWTLPGNVALAVNNNIKYLVLSIKGENEYYVIAKERVEEVFQGREYEVVKEISGADLVGLEYEPLFNVPAFKDSGKKVYYIVDADFVSTEDGTGVVHTAAVYGEDDYNLGLKLDLPIIPALDEKGHFNETVPQFKGVYFKKADKLIIDDLEKNGLLFNKENYTHPYPFCHRCETQLFYNAIPAWFLRVSKLKKKMLKENKKINWYPEHLKHGRFAQGIEQAPDWNISRNRYFATPMPIWECDKCGAREVVGSVEELKDKSGEKDIKDIHNHLIDNFIWQCSKCLSTSSGQAGEMRRISEVFDCWVESGSMSFAQMHYPFENKKKFEDNFPAQYISEYISQTRAWFYVMHVMSVALFNSNSYENVVTTGVILNEHGDKMSKSKKNFPDPWEMINEFGVDSLRFYLMSSSVMHAENLLFNEQELRDVFRKNIMILWNVYKFYEMFAASPQSFSAKEEAVPESANVLDRWIFARLNQLISEATENMNNYNLPRATRPITEFINDLSTWYIRRSRDRFKGDDVEDKKDALAAARFVLIKLSKIIAPFMPFIAEEIWQKATSYNYKDENKSVHLEAWPVRIKAFDGKKDKILEKMENTRKIVELGLAKRDEAGIKVRQPLQKLTVSLPKTAVIDKVYIELIKDEVNVKEVEFKDCEKEIAVDLDLELSPELKAEGMKRELVRFINALRKEAGLTIKDRINIYWEGSAEIKKLFNKYKIELIKDTLALEIKEGIIDNVKFKKEVKVNGEKVAFGIIKK